MDIRIKHFLKQIPLLPRLGYRLREARAVRQLKKWDTLPTQRNQILLATTEGRFNDSCKPIAEYLRLHRPEARMIWVCRDREFLEELPAYITPVQFESEAYYRALATSAVWVFNYLIPQGTRKRDDQLYIQVWHGDKPFKKIANDAAKSNPLYRRRTAGRRFSEDKLCDYFMTGSALFTEIWRRSVGYQGKVLSTGLPRNDILLHPAPDCTPIRQALGLGPDVRVLTYAPTFRDHKLDNGNIGTDIDLLQVLDALEQRYGGQWVCLKRAHGGKKITLENTGRSARVIDVTKYRDMTELLLISDVLLTDYSSCAGDFAYTGRPVLLYQDDFQTYTTMDRQLIFDMAQTPFYVAHTMAELKTLILGLDDEAVRENDRQILALYQSTQTDHSTADICELIIKHMQGAQL